MHWYQRLLCTLVVGFACADTPQEVTIPALVGMNRQTITTHKNELIKRNNINKLLRAGCFTAGGILGLVACYTLYTDCSWFHNDPTDALAQATLTLQEQMARESKTVGFLSEKLLPALNEYIPEVQKLELGEQLAALVKEIKLDKPIDFKVVRPPLWRRVWHGLCDGITSYPVIFGTVTFMLKLIFQDHSLQDFLKGRCSFNAVCKNIEQIGYAVHAIKAAPQVYSEQRIDMVQATAVHAYNNLMRDVERVLGYMEFQIHHHALKEHSTQTDVDFVTFITNDFERSEQEAQQIATRYLAANHDTEQKVASLTALHERLMLYQNMFKLLLDNFLRYEEQVALAL